MSRRWSLLGSLGLVACAFSLILLRSNNVSGDTASPDTTTTDTPPPGFGAPYLFGSGAIAYSDADTSMRADVDGVRQRVETGQGTASYQAFSAAANQAATDAQTEIAARQVGLDGVAEQGVVP